MKVCKLFSCRREREKLESTASLTEVTNESWVLLVGVWVLFVNSIVCLFLCLFFVFEFVFCWDWLAMLWCGWFFLNCFCSESLILAQDERWRRA